MTASRDCDRCPLNAREEPMNGLSFSNGAKSELVTGDSWENTARPLQSATKISPIDRFRMAPYWECQYGVFTDL